MAYEIEADVPSNREDPDSEGSAEKQAQIMLIEDSPLIQASLIDLIKTDPRCNIAAVVDGEDEAMQLLDRNKYDILIIDLQLRNGSGLGVLHRSTGASGLRNYKLLRIVLTNFDSPLLRQRCLDAGADYFFDKAKEFEKVAETIDEWLLNHQLGN